jgi:hypothetical protein
MAAEEISSAQPNDPSIGGPSSRTWPLTHGAATDLFSALLQGIGSPDGQVCLVSRDGKKFAMQENVLASSSDFFKAALESNMRETGI